MKTVFLIVNYNDYKTTIELINNIKNYESIDKILVVDNNSTDNSFNEIKKYIVSNDKIEVIRNVANKGYGSGINFGAKYIKETIGNCYLIVSNSDIVINKNEDIKELINTFDNETAIVAPIIKEHSGINRGWKIPTPFQDGLLNIIYIHRYLRPKLLFYKEDYYKKDVVDVEAVSGCFFAINLEYLEKVDYFDENIFLYYEENVIATKLKRINLKTKINTNVEVFHNHSVTIDKNINKIKKYKELKKSQMYFHRKYNNANIFEQSLLCITNKITLLILKIVYMIKK